MQSAQQDELAINPARRESLPQTLLLALDRVSADERVSRLEAAAASLESGRDPSAGLFEARRGGRLVGAVLVQSHPGRTALVWVPGLVDGESVVTSTRLLESACRWLVEQGVREAHALLEDNPEDEKTLHSAGFSYLADLLYMVSQHSDFPRSRPQGPLDFEPFSSADHDRLLQLVEATYEDTLDCPGLDGVRHTGDALAGYRATGVFSPSRWLIVRHQGHEVGCLLLADHPEQGNWELVYMGLKPAARGHGLGLHMTRHAQWLARQAGSPRLVLAVDAANRPARAVYQRAGFRQWDRRRALLRVLSPSRRQT
jgi:ribosomal protein S18 acetylase RimI-like enzyme